MEKNAPFFVDREVIILTKNGVWIADDTEISHEPTRKLFARSLEKDADGYILRIGKETKKIRVEDTAYFVYRVDGNPQTGYQVILSDETQEKLDPKTINYRPGRLTCLIKGGKEEAKFLHAPYFDVLKELKEDPQGARRYYLEIGDVRVSLNE